MSIFTTPVKALFDAAVVALEKSEKADKTSRLKSREYLDAAYLQAAGIESVTVKTMVAVREATLNQLQESKAWPTNIEGKKVGYQKGMDADAMPCIVYNRLQALIGQDIKKLKETDKLAEKIEQPNDTETANTETTKGSEVDKTAVALQNFLNCFSSKEAAVMYFTTHVTKG